MNEIWNGENYCSSVAGYGMKQNEWNLESCYYGFIYIIICASYISIYIINIFLLTTGKKPMCLFNMFPV